MKKKYLSLSLVIAIALAFSLPINVFAANVTFSTNTTLTLPNGVSLTVIAASTVDSLVINDNSTLTVTVGSGTDITIRSNDVYKFGENVGTQTCVGGSYNQVRITTPTGSHTVSVIQDTACSADESGSGTPAVGHPGGGGGGGTPAAAPTSTSVKINSNDSQTESRNVTLTLSATDAATMSIANKADFSDASDWVTYAQTYAWTLTEGVGTKTVYVKFRSSGGTSSTAVSDSIELTTAAEPVSGEVSSGSGGSAALSNGKASVTVPAGAITGSGTVSITPEADYTAPGSTLKVVGSQAYDLGLTVNGQTVSTFSKAVTLTFTYTNTDISGINEASLKVYYWDTATSQWVSLGGTVDAANNTITVTTTHFTLFAVIGEKTVAKSDQLVKLACSAGASLDDPCKAVYYIGNDGKRYVFPHAKTYNTWYDDFSTVLTVSAEELASYPLGGNVTYRPGVRMIKIQTDPKVYAVEKDGGLRWVKTEAAAAAIYGASWNTMVDDISAAFFTDYTVGSDIEAVADYNKDTVKSNSPDINTDKGL